MKQIPLLQGKALLIELPEGATDPFVAKTYIDEDGHVYKTDPQWLEWSGTYPENTVDLPPGNWRIIGMLSEVTEEQAGTIAEEVRVTNQRTRGFKTYTSDVYGNEGYFESAIKSLESAILADGWTFSNPYGMERPPNLPIDAIPYDQQLGYRAFRNTKPHLQPNAIELSYEFYCLAWQKAQSRVLDRSRCLLLGREG